MEKEDNRILRKNLRQLLRRNKVVSYVIVGAFGVALIVSCFLMSPNTDNLHEMAMSLGTGLVTDIVIMVLLWALVPDLSGQEEDLRDWGLVSIFAERREVKAVSREHLPKHELDVAAYGLKHLRDDINTAKLVKRVQRGLDIRALIPRPHSTDVDARQRLEENADLSAELGELILWLQEVKEQAEKNGSQCKGRVSFQMYEGVQLDFYLRCDDDIYVGPYMPKESSGNSITYQYRADSPGGKYYAGLFKDVWEGRRGVSIVADGEDDVSFGFNQVSAVESVLSYFAEVLRHGSNSRVIGVVAIFKGHLRRTFCSCNKEQGETHHVHRKEEGAVGEVLNRREITGTNVLLLCDYLNAVTFTLRKSGRVEKMTVEGGIPEEMTGSEDMTMIMAAPLVVSSDRGERVVGALTFDYAHYPTEYLNGYQEMVQISQRGDGPHEFTVESILGRKVEETEMAQETLLVIAEMLQTFGKAADIVSRMLGNYADVAYDGFFRGEWGNAE